MAQVQGTKAVGKVLQVIGPVVDVEFAPIADLDETFRALLGLNRNCCSCRLGIG